MSEAAQPTHVLASIGLPVAVSLKWNGKVVTVAVCTHVQAYCIVKEFFEQFAGPDFKAWQEATLHPAMQRVIRRGLKTSLTLEWEDVTGKAVARVVMIQQER